jgi:DNA-binding NarL/FixJ family response regulator
VFDYHPPILRFSPSEQRLLTFALSGVTDEQLAEALGISVSGVKKMWISIHRRVEASMPDLIPESHSREVPTNSRGKEKRRRLLAYLRDHPEELRPASATCSGNSPTRSGKPGTARAFP